MSSHLLTNFACSICSDGQAIVGRITTVMPNDSQRGCQQSCLFLAPHLHLAGIYSPWQATFITGLILKWKWIGYRLIHSSFIAFFPCKFLSQWWRDVLERSSKWSSHDLKCQLPFGVWIFCIKNLLICDAHIWAILYLGNGHLLPCKYVTYNVDGTRYGRGGVSYPLARVHILIRGPALLLPRICCIEANVKSVRLGRLQDLLTTRSWVRVGF